MNTTSISVKDKENYVGRDRQYICLYDHDLKLVDCCANYTALKGLSSANLIGKSVGEVDIDLSATRIDQFRKVLNTGIPCATTRQIKSATKEIFHLEEQILRLNEKLVVVGKDITKSKQEKDKKDEQEYALSLIAKHTSQYFLLTDTKGKILFIDKTYPTLTMEEVIGSCVYDYHDEQNTLIMKETIATVLKTKTPNTYEINAFVKDEKELFFEGTIIPIIENGVIKKLAITTNAITERKEYENELKAINRQYVNLLKMTNSLSYTIDKELKYTSMINPNKSVLNPDADFDERSVIGKTDRELVFPFDKEAAEIAEVDKLEVLRTGKAIRKDSKLVIDGVELYYDLLLQPIFNKKAEVIGISGTSFNITDRIRRNEALEESERKLKEAQEISQLGYYDIDLASGNINWSEETYRIVDLKPNEFSPHMDNFMNLVYEKDKEYLQESLKGIIDTGESTDTTFRRQRKNGSFQYIRNLATARLNDKGQTVSIFGTVQDITQQIELDFELKEQKAFIQKIVDSSPSLIFILDLEKRENVFLNNASQQLLGYSTQEVRDNHNLFLTQLPNITLEAIENNALNKSSASFLSFIHPADRQIFIEFVRMFIENQTDRFYDLSFRHKHKDGQWRWLHHRFGTFNRNAEGKITQILVIVSDVTNIKETETKSKIAMIEGQEKERQRIAKDLHDAINPLLSAAKLNVESLEYHENDCNKEQQTNLSNVISLLSQSMREIKEISFNLMPAILKDFGLVFTLKDYCKTITEGGKLEVNLDIHGVKTRLDEVTEVMLFRIAQELINNVIKHANATQVDIQLIAHQKTLILMVEDNGKGIEYPKNSRPTKNYGLKNVESRVKALNGLMAMDSIKNRGTIITIEIPRK